MANHGDGSSGSFLQFAIFAFEVDKEYIVNMMINLRLSKWLKNDKISTTYCNGFLDSGGRAINGGCWEWNQ